MLQGLHVGCEKVPIAPKTCRQPCFPGCGLLAAARCGAGQQPRLPGNPDFPPWDQPITFMGWGVQVEQERGQHRSPPWEPSFPLVTLLLLSVPGTGSSGRGSIVQQCPWKHCPTAACPVLQFQGMMGRNWGRRWKPARCEQSCWASCYTRTSTHTHAHPPHPRWGSVCICVCACSAFLLLVNVPAGRGPGLT